MKGHTQGLKYENLGAVLSSTDGSLQDRELQWLRDSGETMGSIMDMYHEMLVGRGFTGTNQEMLYEYLGSLGYTGALLDRIHQWWAPVVGLHIISITENQAGACLP